VAEKNSLLPCITVHSATNFGQKFGVHTQSTFTLKTESEALKKSAQFCLYGAFYEAKLFFLNLKL